MPSAREKLNEIYVLGCIAWAVIVGMASQSLLVSILTFVAGFAVLAISGAVRSRRGSR